MPKSTGLDPNKLKDIKTPQEVENLYTSLGLPSQFCPVPFSSVVFEADGAVCLCRQKGNYFEIGNLKNNSLEEIWNSKNIVNIRKEFLSGHVITCKNEIAADKCNLNPSRVNLLQNINLNSIQQSLPVKISPNFNGLCNLKCPMCRVWSQENGLYDKLQFWQKLESDILPHLFEIDTFSGEPFIQKDTYRLINLASQINPHILWSFTTNGQWRWSSYIQEHLNKIKIKMLTFSIDSMSEEILSKIRPGSRLNILLKCVDSIVEYNKRRTDKNGSFKIGINLTVQKDNWPEILDIIHWGRKNSFYINARLLTEPFELSVLSDSSEKNITRIQNLILNMDTQDKPYVSPLIKPMLRQLSFAERKDVLNSWLDH